MERFGNGFMTIEQMTGTYLTPQKAKKPSGTSDDSFAKVLEEVQSKNNGIVFSKHANERLASRNIRLDDTQMNRLNQGIEKAKAKSINESLVMMDNIAFIVNVKNNTVITAMDQESNDSNVFTNIDGAVIV